MIRGKPDSARKAGNNIKDTSPELRRSRKQRFNDSDRDLINRLADQIAEKDYSELQKVYDFWTSRVGKYSRLNVFGLYLQNPDMQRPVTLREMRKHGHKLKKGAKVYEIIRPIFLKLDAEGNVIKGKKSENKPVPENEEEGIRVDEETPEVEVAETKKIFWPVNCVVDLGVGTEGPPLQMGLDSHEGVEDLIEALKEFAASRNIEIKTMAGSFAGAEGALGTSDGKGTITVYSGMTPEHQFATMVHEMAHEMIHDLDSRKEEKWDRKTRELHAEGVSYLVLSNFGIKGDKSALYLKSYKVDADDLREHFDIISKTARTITYNIEKVLKSKQDVETEIDNSPQVVEDVEELNIEDIDEIASCIKF